jgi:hypothetical protein
MNSISSSQLSRGLIPRACASASITVRSSRSCSHSSSLALFSPNILSKSRMCLLLVVCSTILLSYSCRAALSLVHSSSREVLTWARAFSEILTFSSLVVRASSLWVSSPSWARSSSTTAVDDAAVMLEDNEGGGLCRAYEDKLIACHVTFQPTTMNT